MSNISEEVNSYTDRRIGELENLVGAFTETLTEQLDRIETDTPNIGRFAKKYDPDLVQKANDNKAGLRFGGLQHILSTMAEGQEMEFIDCLARWIGCDEDMARKLFQSYNVSRS